MQRRGAEGEGNVALYDNLFVNRSGPAIHIQPALDTTGLTGYLDWNLDWNGSSRLTGFRGAYSGDTTNPGWQPSLAIKP